MLESIIEPLVLVKEQDYWVIVKPCGMNFHNEDGEKGLVQYMKDHYPQQDFYPIHRLDKITSGLLLVATNKTAAQLFSALFTNHKIEKYYVAISDRKPKKKQGAIKGGMVPARRGSWMLTKAKENWAYTQFFSTSMDAGLRLFLLKPKTGKTHQLRVALKSIGAPILGDRRYGGTEHDRGYLHAFQLVFVWQGEVKTYQYLPDSGECFAKLHQILMLNNWLKPQNLPWPKT